MNYAAAGFRSRDVLKGGVPKVSMFQRAISGDHDMGELDDYMHYPLKLLKRLNPKE